MPAKRAIRPTLRAGSVPTGGDVKIADIPRQLAGLSASVQRVEGKAKDRVAFVADLAVGVNRLNHGLGRVPTGATVTPTTADASWAWALTDKSATQIEITTVGVAQAGAALEVF